MDENNNMVMPVSPYGTSGNSMFGGGELAWIILFIALFAGGGWGNNGGGAGGMYPWLNQSDQINNGFRDQFLSSSVAGIQSSVTNGFSDVQTSMCAGFAGVANGFAQAEIAENARQLAYLQQLSDIQSQLAQCCCDNRLATCQSQNIVATESAATRAAIQSGVQAILDKMCADKIDEKNETIVALNNKINALESNNYIQNALTAQTQYFLGLYPRPTTTTTTTTGANG